MEPLALQIHDRRLSPTEAEIWISAGGGQPGDELRGRVVGPTCAYSSTIEVAYPFLPFPILPEGLPATSRRVVIPEPSMWSPTTPFLYRVIAELWRGGGALARGQARHGLRYVEHEPSGVKWNGRAFDLLAVVGAGYVAETLPRLRDRGVNTLILEPGTAGMWDLAERLGFAVVGRGEVETPDLMRWCASPACLGWMLKNANDEQARLVRARRRLVITDSESEGYDLKIETSPTQPEEYRIARFKL